MERPRKTKNAGNLRLKKDVEHEDSIMRGYQEKYNKQG